jgi:UPF0176 protein
VNDAPVAILTFYRFVDIDDPERLRAELEAEAIAADLRGTILLAREGINATLAGPEVALDDFWQGLTARAPFAGLTCRRSRALAGSTVFRRLKVRVKDEIVALRQPDVRPAERTGEAVDWARWHALLDDPDVLVIDTRNAYEIGVGTFPGAVDPETRSFRQWPDWVREHLAPAQHRRVAMFCTGGIRCEKASAWLLGQGFESVYQLEGGVLGYLANVPAGENRWSGECYVFDARVAVDVALAPGSTVQCDACGRPLLPDAQAHPAYKPGISCPLCVDEKTEERRAGFAERVRQARLAAGRRATG